MEMDVKVDLSGRVALVTGSTSGMGEAIARAFARSGAIVALHGLGEAEAIGNLVDELHCLSGREVAYFDHDLTDAENGDRLVDEVIRKYGRLDILVNNAGIQHVSDIADFPPEAWKRVLAVDLSAAFFATRRAVAGMRKRGWGRIVNTASTLGLVAELHKAAYVSAKHGLIGLTRATALDTAEDGVTCNAICPGWVLTPLASRQLDAAAERLELSREETARDHFLLLQPTRRFVEVDEVAATALFLCSNAAASITGVALPVDGGQMII
ncbi:D-beta-hydroxybutyrate dehydrogenase [Tsuneonella dongtanensis]|uniref:D-beta-hydroxybutyrate dehydrogenase n=1 Tax=Tsuneonella dongtanensis TaxID=692370 RepID=A0A1B2A905_9SPHN|nr:3-hydroxybutyrate dehydrogenase [Tsuneonella dongtanensis]ANY18647.1 D-beta-hydroxybutyrate dehydrogenase [Tsuneonella dongtanensis]